MLQEEEIFRTVSEIATKALNRDITVDASTPLSELAADSLSLIEIVFEIEERLNVNLPFNANEFAKVGSNEITVGDLVRMARESIANDVNASNDKSE
jgi:acyl carrier protein